MADGSGAAGRASSDSCPDGRKLIAVAGDGAVEVWDLSTRNAVTKIAAGGPEVWSGALARDGGFVAVGRGTGDIDLFETAKLQRLVSRTFHGHWGAVAGIAFLSDDRTLISGNPTMARVQRSFGT